MGEAERNGMMSNCHARQCAKEFFLMFSVRKNSFLNLTGAASNRRSIKTINSLKAFVV